tara:strand:+ start:535 stop:1032 length:498 start_codon:yes stop_codon:yes gene_type:complete
MDNNVWVEVASMSKLEEVQLETHAMANRVLARTDYSACLEAPVIHSVLGHVMGNAQMGGTVRRLILTVKDHKSACQGMAEAPVEWPVSVTRVSQIMTAVSVSVSVMVSARFVHRPVITIRTAQMAVNVPLYKAVAVHVFRALRVQAWPILVTPANKARTAEAKFV